MIETKRLQLTPVEPKDLELFQKLFRCPETTKYLPGGQPYDDDYIEQYLEQKQEHWLRGFGTFVVVDKTAPSVKLGYAGVEEIDDSNLLDIRYALLPEFQGQGYALEAARAAIEFTFEREGCAEIFGVAVPANSPSVSLLEKLGMTRRNDLRLYPDNSLVTMSISNPNA
ncbi:GNAT family N-acetyltransferase [Vibrio sp. SCSIO 43136]|uniref:GNAT family N-acetyltransferase n=1 Tax=Vibrio sp. SCSIO 43136 TaxID=2819101 RepID=UPI0020764B66|nr:GNAT family N-acetyltransferase [Vibrio sp. SCSIO 43136]USD66806.1 GNAT family N-acetyltransferase [Vibrio sp. SCSIO 43136]